MPIYEYRCADCKRKVSLFFGSFSVAESRTASGEIECPRCGGKNLSRLISRANIGRGATDSGGDYGDMDDGMGGMFDGMNEDDPRAIARWARRMKDTMGDEVDMGPEFDQALARIEAGEDPDKVMEDMDPEALAGVGADMDDDDGEDFSSLDDEL